MPARLEDLPTPCAVVDAAQLDTNTRTMAERASRAGVRLRPHVKTHKCPEIARLQVRGHFGGITVSTLAEARGFAAAGFRDVTYAVPISEARAAEALDLARSLDALHLLADQEDTVDGLERLARSRGERALLLLKIDCGYGRAGVRPEDPRAAALARRIYKSPSLIFRGVLTHAGHSYACRGRGEVAAVAAAERDVPAEFAARLRAEGIESETVSAGSTPTCSVQDDWRGVTELRPGNYVYYDAFQEAAGSCAPGAAAFSVLASVLSRYDARREFLVDAGALALSKDPGPVHLDPECGYGRVLRADGSPVAGLRVDRLSQEHGVLRSAGDAPMPPIRVGEKLRIVPNHSCLSAACFENVHLVDGGAVTAVWPTVRGW